MSGSGYLAFLRKEALEIRRTWRIWVLPGLLLFFGFTSPVLARIAPNLVKSLTADQPGTIIQLPEPVPLDAYVQMAKSLTQIVLLALVIASADLIAGERRSGTAVLVLTKPLTRAAFVLAKVTAQAALLVAATLLGVAVCWLGTRLIFARAPIGVLATAVAVWLVLALLIIAVATLLSTVMRAQAGAAGVGLGVYAALALLGEWGPARRFTPAGLFAAVDAALHGRHDGVAWPVATGLALATLCVLAAVRVFQRQELAQGSAG